MPRPPHSRVPISPPDGATLNDTVPNLPGSAIIDDGGIGTGGVIAIGVVTGLIVLSLIGFVVWFIKKKNQNITAHGGHIVPSPQRTAPIAGKFLSCKMYLYHGSRAPSSASATYIFASFTKVAA